MLMEQQRNAAPPGAIPTPPPYLCITLFVFRRRSQMICARGPNLNIKTKKPIQINSASLAIGNPVDSHQKGQDGKGLSPGSVHGAPAPRACTAARLLAAVWREACWVCWLQRAPVDPSWRDLELGLSSRGSALGPLRPGDRTATFTSDARRWRRLRSREESSQGAPMQKHPGVSLQLFTPEHKERKKTHKQQLQQRGQHRRRRRRVLVPPGGASWSQRSWSWSWSCAAGRTLLCKHGGRAFSQTQRALWASADPPRTRTKPPHEYLMKQPNAAVDVSAGASSGRHSHSHTHPYTGRAAFLNRRSCWASAKQHH